MEEKLNIILKTKDSIITKFFFFEHISQTTLCSMNTDLSLHLSSGTARNLPLCRMP